MALITNAEVEQARDRVFGTRLRYSQAGDILQAETKKTPMTFQFDIFLSHAYADAGMSQGKLLGLKALLEELGYTVYVDWVIDNHLNREDVNDQTARWLRQRMVNSQCLLFATSQNFQSSKWMPWEIGFKDGDTGKNGELGTVSVLPVVQQFGRQQYEGQEYLGMYPYIQKDTTQGTGKMALWVHDDAETYINFDSWLAGSKPYKRS